jgi:isoleucyl-tRNA synthetase
MELARADKTLGSSLEATITLHIQNPAVAAWLSGLNASGNAADELKYLLITSGVTLVDSAEAAADGALASSSVDTGAEVAGVVTVGVHKAAGAKCARCWMYSTQVRWTSANTPVCLCTWLTQPLLWLRRTRKCSYRCTRKCRINTPIRI